MARGRARNWQGVNVRESIAVAVGLAVLVGCAHKRQEASTPTGTSTAAQPSAATQAAPAAAPPPDEGWPRTYESGCTTPDTKQSLAAAAPTRETFAPLEGPPSFPTAPETKRKPSLQSGPAPRIIVATAPTELIVTEGQPNYVPITGTSLLFVKNTTARGERSSARTSWLSAWRGTVRLGNAYHCRPVRTSTVLRSPT
jgi:hypothetical protein